MFSYSAVYGMLATWSMFVSRHGLGSLPYNPSCLLGKAMVATLMTLCAVKWFRRVIIIQMRVQTSMFSKVFIFVVFLFIGIVLERCCSL
jgi:hypothetical protein